MSKTISIVLNQKYVSLSLLNQIIITFLLHCGDNSVIKLLVRKVCILKNYISLWLLNTILTLESHTQVRFSKNVLQKKSLRKCHVIRLVYVPVGFSEN
jgi:hypothetical protein